MDTQIDWISDRDWLIPWSSEELASEFIRRCEAIFEIIGLEEMEEVDVDLLHE